VPTFGSAGQLSSVAVEFHIYCFVGALFFFFIGRNRFWALAMAIISAPVPLGYFSNIPNSDRSLFVIWLMGFAACFIARGVRFSVLEPVQDLLVQRIFIPEPSDEEAVSERYKPGTV